jgi:predicted hydrocarbon binding protein
MTNMQALSQIDRPELGETIPLSVFRIFRQFSAQHSIDILGERGVKTTFTYAGRMLGLDVGKSLYDENFDIYLAKVKDYIYEAKIGILELVDSDAEKLVFQLGECITCAGMPDLGSKICHFEVGLVAGIAETYLKKRVSASETKCNVNGDDCCEVTIILDPLSAHFN